MDKSKYMQPFDATPAKKTKKKKSYEDNVKEKMDALKNSKGIVNKLKARKAMLDSL